MTNQLGCIGGGQMGEALIKGILQSGLYRKEDIIVAEPEAKRRDYLATTYAISTEDSSLSLWPQCDTVILAVKPQVMEALLKASRDHIGDHHLLITIAAGLPLSFYSDCLGSESCRIVRVMPNTPCLVLEGASAISGNDNATAVDLEKAKAIFNAVGKALVVDETYLDAVTGLSGSGPAYVFTFVEALIDAGIKCGLPRAVAETLTLQTVIGSVRLLQESGEHPAALRARVTSPGGTTISALHVLEKAGFTGIVMDAVEAAAKRSMELGKGR
jgi:pyrroline-5-carboxylate reductase